MPLKVSLLALALPVYGAVHESLAGLPAGWRESSISLHPSRKMHMQVALQYQNLDSLEAKLKAVSEPNSPLYGHYLDLNDMNSAFGASKEAESKVMSWLQQSGASDVVSHGSMLDFTATIEDANKMLDTTFKVYTNGEKHQIGTTAYSIPDDLGDAIDLVSPTTYFSNMRPQRALPSEMENALNNKRQLQTSCEMVISIPISTTENRSYTVLGPDCFKQLYNIGGYQADPSSGSTIAFSSFLEQSASYSDLALFEEIYNIPSQNFTVLALVNGGVDNQDPITEQDGEANLDVQNIIGLVDGLPVGEYITGGLPPFVPTLLQPNASDNQNEPYLQFYEYLLSQPNSNLPYVITNSYGDEENGVPERYAKRVCNQIGMMGLRGRTILESSGDLGVGGSCRSNMGDMQAEFTPIFPATCPYVTAVGGTQSYNPEVAWNASSGGFSFYFPTAWYQESAIQTYLSKYISTETKEYYSSNGYVDFKGRGFPDISAHSLWPDYLTVINGTAQPNGGTSAASPVVAAIVALLNDARLRAGKPAMGFINPFLYGNAAGKALNDITLGGAVGCSGVSLQTGQNITGGGVIPYASWNATEAWDPVTGLGTPNFQELKDLALSVCNQW